MDTITIALKLLRRETEIRAASHAHIGTNSAADVVRLALTTSH